MDIHDDYYHRQLNRLEAILSRHWPELPAILNLDSASLLELLIAFGSPQAVAASSKKAAQLLRRVGGSRLAQDKIERAVASASSTLGVPPIAEECQLLKSVAHEARRASKKAKKAKDTVKELSQENDVVACMGEAVGKVTAAVTFSYLGDPNDFSCANAYLKAAGLNLKERSSGKYKGHLKITKRGPSIVRKYLYLAVLRKLQDDECFQAWHQRKIERDGGKKIKSVVALMRKLLKALFHVGHGEAFDSTCLFDLKRLHINK